MLNMLKGVILIRIWFEADFFYVTFNNLFDISTFDTKAIK